MEFYFDYDASEIEELREQYPNNLVAGFQLSSFGKKVGLGTPEISEEMTTTGRIAMECGQMLGNTIEPLAIAVIVAAATPITAGVATTTAISMAASAVYTFSDELFRQQRDGEEVDIPKVFHDLNKDWIASFAAVGGVKFMKPVFDLVEKLPYKEAQMFLTEAGKFLTELGTSLAVKAGYGDIDKKTVQETVLDILITK